MNQKRFNIDTAIKILKESYKSWNAPIITFLANRGATPFEILVSTLLSLRTKDEVTSLSAQALFKHARTPEEIIALGTERIAQLIYPAGFYKTKAHRLVQIAQLLIDVHHGQVPETMEELTKLPGVGRKTANLVMVEGFKKEGLCVDTHVHRISNRFGYVDTKTPEQTEFALREKLPKRHWVVYNEILVAFGQTICRPVSPFCSRCPLDAICPKKSVTKKR